MYGRFGRQLKRLCLLFALACVCIFIFAPRGVWPFGLMTTQETWGQPMPTAQPTDSPPGGLVEDPAYAEAYARGMHVYTHVLRQLSASDYGGSYFGTSGWMHVLLLGDERAREANDTLRGYMHAVRLHENTRYSYQELTDFYHLFVRKFATPEALSSAGGMIFQTFSIDVVNNRLYLIVRDMEKAQAVFDDIPKDAVFIELYEDYLARTPAPPPA